MSVIWVKTDNAELISPDEAKARIAKIAEMPPETMLLPLPTGNFLAVQISDGMLDFQNDRRPN